MENHLPGGKRDVPSKISEEQKDVLKKKCNEGDFKHSSQVAAWLMTTYQISYSSSGLRKLLYGMNMSWTTTRPIHPLRNVEFNELWKEHIFSYRLAQGCGKSLFHDEMRLGLIGQSRRAWYEKGIRLQQKRQISYEWIYLSLWIDVEASEIYWEWIDNMKAETFKPLVEEKVKAGYKSIIWDRAPGHRSCSNNNERLANFIMIPPYSPELNPVERVFQEIRRNVEGIVYLTLEEKKEAVEKYLSSLSKEEIRSITYWKYTKNAFDLVA